ncbi:hypothetical protein BDR26DRAFT_917536 [Obelidium mucronatum]|nr:hypothetical protein BDR26DRAFT_917536 [Obelidium mucronatum]
MTSNFLVADSAAGSHAESAEDGNILTANEAPTEACVVDIAAAATTMPSRRGYSSCLIADLLLKPQDSVGTLLFDELLPSSMEGLVGVLIGCISSQLFADRIHDLNSVLKERQIQSECGPLIRLLCALFAAGLSLCLFAFACDSLVISLGLSAIWTLALGIALLTSVKRKSERSIIRLLKAYNQEDHSIRLLWRLSGGHQPFFHYRMLPFCRRISIRHVTKDGSNLELEFLPAYSDRYVLVAESQEEDMFDFVSTRPRLPSYKSTV